MAGTEVWAGEEGEIPAREFRGRLPDEEAVRREWFEGETEEEPIEVVKLAKALEVFSKAMEAKDRRLFLETETVAEPESGWCWLPLLLLLWAAEGGK